MASPLTPEILNQLKARHVAFIRARLASPEGAAAFRAGAAAAHEALLAARVGDVLDGRALALAADAALTSDAVERAARPLVKRLLPVVLAELGAEKGKVGDRLPPAGKKRLDVLLARPGLMPERFLREIAEQDVIDEIMRDVLYDGFKEFSEKVNPFTAEWGIPSLLKRLSVLGGTVARGLETVRAEFDRRLEPEIRRFLAGYSRPGLRRMVDATIARADQPSSIAVRRHLAAWVLEQEIAALARSADAEALALAAEIGLDVAGADLARDARRTRRRELIEAAVEAVKDRTVGDALTDLGVTLRLDAAAVDALAAAAWPAVKTALESPAMKAWLEGVVGEFYDGEIAALGA